MTDQLESRTWTAGDVTPADLLNDEQVATFVRDGYLNIHPEFRAGLNKEIEEALEALGQNPGDEILDEVPQLYEVWNHPQARGALRSVLGENVSMNKHRHWHMRPPSPHSQGWHQDSRNVRHHQCRVVLALYYPTDVTVDMGATVIMPGTHFRNAPTDRMASYGNIRGQVALTVPAGTIAITHYDLWHGGSINRSDRKRHMLKFLFNRQGTPTAPSWNHDPIEGDNIANRVFAHWPPYVGQSDSYKSRTLARECWNHMCGRTEPATV